MQVMGGRQQQQLQKINMRQEHLHQQQEMLRQQLLLSLIQV
jgi:hypothetical protein